jgi:hypothetical protein
MMNYALNMNNASTSYIDYDSASIVIVDKNSNPFHDLDNLMRKRNNFSSTENDEVMFLFTPENVPEMSNLTVDNMTSRNEGFRDSLTIIVPVTVSIFFFFSVVIKIRV